MAADDNGFRIERGVKISKAGSDIACRFPQGRQGERVSFARNPKNLPGVPPVRPVSDSAPFGVEPFQCPLGSVLFPAAGVSAHAAAAIRIEARVAELRASPEAPWKSLPSMMTPVPSPWHHHEDKFQRLAAWLANHLSANAPSLASFS